MGELDSVVRANVPYVRGAGIMARTEWPAAALPHAAAAVAPVVEGGAVKDPGHLTFLRSLPCAVYMHPPYIVVAHHKEDVDPEILKKIATAAASKAIPSGYTCSPDVEAHHRTGAGLALKASDHEAFPLCRKHHREFHDANGLFKGWTRAQRKEWQQHMVKLYQPIDEVF